MVLNAMHLPFELPFPKCALELGLYRLTLGLISDAVKDEAEIRSSADREADLPQHVG